jgi:hypothetical protein
MMTDANPAALTRGRSDASPAALTRDHDDSRRILRSWPQWPRPAKAARGGERTS